MALTFASSNRLKDSTKAMLKKLFVLLPTNFKETSIRSAVSTYRETQQAHEIIQLV